MAHAGPAEGGTTQTVSVTDGSDFSMDLDPRMADACVFIPETKVDEANCEGIDTVGAALAVQREEKTPIFAAIGKLKDSKVMIMVAREPAKAEVKPDQVDAFATTLRNGMGQGAELVTPLPPPDASRVNGVQVIEVTALARGPRVDAQLWMSVSTIFTASATYMVWATTDAAHANDASDIVHASFRTLKAQPASATTTSPEEKSVRTGDLIGRILAAVAGVVFLGVVIWLVARRRTPLPEPDETRRPKRKRKVVSWDKNRDGP